MFRLILIACALASLGTAQQFTFQIGSPVASQEVMAKTAAFVFRTEGCAEPAKPQVSGTAEGLVKGERRSVPLRISAMTRPGVFAVYQTWSGDGAWVVNLKGTCGASSAGAIIPIGPKGLIRESAKFLTRPSTDAEVEASLKALPQGGNK